MLRTFFSALGVLFAALIVFCASFLGNLAVNIDKHAAEYESLAVDITRELSHTWSLADIETRCAKAATDEAGPAAQQALDTLKPLGALLYADDIAHKTRWTRSSWSEMRSPAVAAERLAELLRRTVKVTFVAKFAGGFANVTAELKSEGGRMKLWRLQIDSREKIRPQQELQRRVISHA
jgi:hypothetical protein